MMKQPSFFFCFAEDLNTAVAERLSFPASKIFCLLSFFLVVEIHHHRYLSRADFARTLRRLVRLQEHELQYLFELFDGNGNDIIEYREFVQFMLQNGEEAARQIATAEKFNRVSSSTHTYGRLLVNPTPNNHRQVPLLLHWCSH